MSFVNFTGFDRNNSLRDRLMNKELSQVSYSFFFFFSETIEFYNLRKFYTFGAKAPIFTRVHLALQSGIIPLQITKIQQSNFAQAIA